MSEIEEQKEIVKDYYNLFKIVEKQELKDWVLCLPEYLEKKYTPITLKIYRSQRRHKLTWLTCDNAYSINWIELFDLLFNENEIFYSKQYITHYFLLCLIDMPYEVKGKIFKQFLSNLPSSHLSSLKENIKDVINKNMNTEFSNINLDDEKSFNPIMNSILREFDDSLLKPLYNYLLYSSDPNIFSLIMSLNKIAFSIFIYVGSCTEKIVMNSKDILEYELIKENDDKYLFIYFSHMKDMDFEYFDISLFKEIIIKYWSKYGSLFLGKFFNIQRKIEIEAFSKHKQCFREIIETWHNDKQYSFIEVLKWPSDFQSLIMIIFSNKDNHIHFSDELLKAVNISLLNNFSIVNVKSIFEQYFFPTNILNNPTEYEMYIAICLATNSIIESSNTNYKKWEKEIKNIMYMIKPLFYSGYEGIRIASVITEILLVFITSIVSFQGFNDMAYKNIKKILKMISNLILYPYIRNSERNEDIWNYDRVYADANKKYFQNKELYLINHNLKLILESNDEKMIDAFEDFIDTWINFSSVQWPWYRNKKSITNS